MFTICSRHRPSRRSPGRRPEGPGQGPVKPESAGSGPVTGKTRGFWLTLILKHQMQRNGRGREVNAISGKGSLAIRTPSVAPCVLVGASDLVENSRCAFGVK